MKVVLLVCLFACACQNGSKSAEPKVEPKLVSQPATPPAKTIEFPNQKGLEAVRLPGALVPAPWLEGASKVVVVAGKGGPVIVAAGTGWLRWFDRDGKRLGEHTGEGAAQVLEAIDVDGDGKQELLIGRGMGRGAADAPISLQIVNLDATGKSSASEEVALPVTTRAQVVAVRAVPKSNNELWVASYVSKYHVQVSRLGRDVKGHWVVQETRGKHRVVGDMDVLPDGMPIIARMYGDEPDEDGAVYALPSATEMQQLPSTRGARAIVTLPDANGKVAMADGWHKEYGQKAQGIISVTGRSGNDWESLAATHVKGCFGYSQLRLGDVHRLPGTEIIASGNGPAVVMVPTRPDLLYKLGDVVAVDAFAADLGDDERMEVVIAGPKPAIWNPR